LSGLQVTFSYCIDHFYYFPGFIEVAGILKFESYWFIGSRNPLVCSVQDLRKPLVTI
jgi:hypothetical protein